MITPPGRALVVGAIIVARGRVLLGYRHPAGQYYPGCWDVPGGHVEAGENSQDALRRELCEELSIDVDLADRTGDSGSWAMTMTCSCGSSRPGAGRSTSMMEL